MPLFENNDSFVKNKIKKIFENEFTGNLNLKSTSEFDPFDLIDEENQIIIECKKRNVKKNSYKTTMVGFNKYLEAQKYYNLGYQVFFVFDFIDGVYYFEFENQIFHPRLGGRSDRGIKEIKEYIWIDVEDLNLINLN